MARLWPCALAGIVPLYPRCVSPLTVHRVGKLALITLYLLTGGTISSGENFLAILPFYSTIFTIFA